MNNLTFHLNTLQTHQTQGLLLSSISQNTLETTQLCKRKENVDNEAPNHLQPFAKKA